jgi:hypothetical protein
MAAKEPSAIYLVKITKCVNGSTIGFHFPIEAPVEKANQKLRDLLGLWNDSRRGRPMPSRADLSVTALRPWLGNLALIDLSAGGMAVFRLSGTNLRARFGGEMTRRDVTVLSAEIGQSFRDCIARTCQTRAPTKATHERVIDGASVAFRELFLPLSDDASRVHTLLFASYPVTKNGDHGGT